MASKIARETGADILEITLKTPYPANYRKTLSRANRERIQNDPPELAMQLPDLSQYYTIYLGYQTWAMNLSQPMKAFLLQYGGKNNTYTSALVVDGNRVDESDAEGKRWLKNI